MRRKIDGFKFVDLLGPIYIVRIFYKVYYVLSMTPGVNHLARGIFRRQLILLSHVEFTIHIY